MKIYADFYAESLICAEFTLKKSHGECTCAINRAIFCSIFQPAMATAEGKITLHLPSQHHHFCCAVTRTNAVKSLPDEEFFWFVWE
ncbi:MAG: hypothetical protein ACLRME_09180 [Faecalibacterium prausnitzii]